MAVKVEVGLEDLSAEKIVSQIFSKQITAEEVVSHYCFNSSAILLMCSGLVVQQPPTT